MTASQHSRDRRLRIALARARIGVQRKELAFELQDLRQAATPASVGRELLAAARARGASRTLLSGLFGLRRRYPLLLSLASGLLPGPVRPRLQIVWRLAAVGLTAWALSRHLRKGGPAPD